MEVAMAALPAPMEAPVPIPAVTPAIPAAPPAVMVEAPEQAECDALTNRVADVIRSVAV